MLWCLKSRCQELWCPQGATMPPVKWPNQSKSPIYISEQALQKATSAALFLSTQLEGLVHTACRPVSQTTFGCSVLRWEIEWKYSNTNLNISFLKQTFQLQLRIIDDLNSEWKSGIKTIMKMKPITTFKQNTSHELILKACDWEFTFITTKTKRKMILWPMNRINTRLHTGVTMKWIQNTLLF